MTNIYLHPEHTKPFSYLENGEPLYPAYHPPSWACRIPRRMGHWTGQVGEWVCVTKDEQFYKQIRLWGNSEPSPRKWQKFKLG